MKRLIRGARMCVVVLAGMIVAGCAAVPGGIPVKSGDNTAVRFTCRLGNGDIAVTTEKRIAENASLRKSNLFVPRGDEEALAVTAGGAPSKELLAFEDRVSEKIAAAIVGMTQGEQRTVQIRGERQDNVSLGAESTIKIARVMHRSKEMTLEAGSLTSPTGKPPVVGEVLELGKERLPATVVSMSDGSVSVRLTPKPGMRIDTPFGMGTVRETPTDFEIVIDAPVGSLVRSGPLVGRIVEVGDTDVTIDYSDPFGGEELTCDIAVEAPGGGSVQGSARAD